MSLKRINGDNLQQKEEQLLQKLPQKEQLKKTAEATENLIENKIADEINSLGKPKEKKKKIEEIYVPRKKDNK